MWSPGRSSQSALSRSFAACILAEGSLKHSDYERRFETDKCWELDAHKTFFGLGELVGGFVLDATKILREREARPHVKAAISVSERI